MRNVYNEMFDKEIWEKVNEKNKSIMNDYLLELKQRKKSNGTITQYKADIRAFLCYLYKYENNIYVLDVNKKQLRDFSLFLTYNNNVSNSRHNRFISVVRSLLYFAEENQEDYGNFEANVARRLKSLDSKEKRREIHFLKDEDISYIMKKLEERGEYQESAFLAMLYDSAGRRNEVLQVRKDSFSFERNNTNKVVGKRKKVFSLLYFDRTKDAVKKWLIARGKDDVDSLWAVPIPQTRFKRPAREHDVYRWFLKMKEILKERDGEFTNFNVHSIRHSALQNYSDGSHYVCKKLGISGFPIEKLKLLANHSDLTTTSNYLKDNSINEIEGMFGIKIE
ncbi:MAG: hypothetical protein KatS3mg002_1042 [Candidatus Woesearchaeota archaeon]|jgi:integrase|nr:MAG: hypothetical protein KatS3mg002_1042 [Candidatus Woesearchaeota archaeon]